MTICRNVRCEYEEQEEVSLCQIQSCFKLRHPRSCPVALKGHSIHTNAKLPFKKKVSQEKRGKISSYSFQKGSLIIVNLHTDNMLHCTKCETFTKDINYDVTLSWLRLHYLYVSLLSFFCIWRNLLLRYQ